MMHWRVSVGEEAGIMEEVADALRIMQKINGANDSNFLSFEDFLFRVFSRGV